MPRTDAGPQRPPRVPGRAETADLHVAVCSGSPQLALDLAGVTFMDCAGVNVLLATRRRAQLEEGSVRVVRASPRVLRMISLLGLERAFALE
jgi:anti-sigma B factor antagonist